MAPADTTVAFAAREAGGCRVVGYVTTRDPGPNRVLFVLGMPDQFRGRYLYLGVGGSAGLLPLLPQELLAKGFALAGSDGGTGAKNIADYSFMKDPAKAADYLGRGVHVTARATQQIARAYYAKPALYRYIAGCSGGGNMGMMNAMRFGSQDFDGFIVGSTPWGGQAAQIPNIFRIAQYLQTHPEGWIPPELAAKADQAILATYDSTDGAVDGIIADQRNIKDFDVGILGKVGFTSAQIATFNLIRLPQRFSGPKIGDTVLAGFSITNVAAWSSFLLGTSPPPWPETDTESAADVAAKGAPYIHILADTNTRARHPHQDYAKVTRSSELTQLAMETENGGNVPSADAGFATIAGSNVKIVYYHGVNDQANSYLTAIDAYQALSARDPGAVNWMRVFFVPGMQHCRGGVGPTDAEERLIDATVAWVENGQAPETVVAERQSPTKGIERTFRLCAEPKRAVLKNADLDPRDATNWECRTPP
jgi:feruloyl esterase